MTAIKYTYDMSFEDIDKGIKSVGTRGTKLRNDTHSICVSLLSRWIKTGDVSVPCSKATVLVDTADGYHSQALVNWFTVHAGFKWDTDAKAFTYSTTTMDLDRAKAAKDEPYWTLTPPKEVKAFDLPSKVMALIKQAEKKRGKGLTDEDTISEEMITQLKAVVGVA